MAGSGSEKDGGRDRGRPPAEPRSGRSERTVYRSEHGRKGRHGGAGSGRRRRAGAYAAMSADERRRLQRRVWVLRGGAVLVFVVGVLVLVYFTVGRGDAGGPSASPSPTTASSRSPSASPCPSPTAASASPTPSATPSVALLPPSARSRPVPILMYHVLATPPAGARNLLFVSLADFTVQVRWLHSHGYHSVTLTQLFDYWAGTGSLPVKPIVFSFDDGYRSDWSVGGRVLSRYGYAGILNLEVDNIMPKGGITPRQVNWLLDLGWELAAHTIHHYDLTTLGATQLAQEVGGSRRALQHRFHVPVDFFCYPSGSFNDTVVAAVKAAGFRGATTTIDRLATRGNAYRLPRIRVDGGESLQRFIDDLLRH